MPRRSHSLSFATGLALLLLAGILMATYGQDFLYQYGWTFFIGVFVLALIGRIAESVQRRRRMSRFRQRG